MTGCGSEGCTGKDVCRGCRGDTGHSDFASECRIAEDLRGGVIITLRVGGNDHDRFLRVVVMVGLAGRRSWV